MGLSMVLYSSSLLVVESLDFRPSSQCIFVRVRPNCFFLVQMCLCQVSRLSRWRPSLTSSDWGSWTSLIWTGGQVARPVVKVTCVDLVSLNFILHRLSQFASMSVWRRCEATAGSLSDIESMGPVRVVGYLDNLLNKDHVQRQFPSTSTPFSTEL
jgi:hypothetical protein